MQSLSADIGIGFLADESGSTPAQGKKVYHPWQVLLVSGDYRAAWPFIAQYADVVVFETNDAVNFDAPPPLPGRTISRIYWEHSDAPDSAEDDGVLVFLGNLTTLPSELTKALRELAAERVLYNSRLHRSPLSSMSSVPSVRVLEMQQDTFTYGMLEAAMRMQQFAGVRKQFLLQASFAVEIKAEFEIKKPNLPPARHHELEQEIFAEQAKRRQLVHSMRKCTLVQLLLGGLNIADQSTRIMYMMQFEKLVQRHSETAALAPADALERAFQALSMAPNDDQLKKVFYTKKHEYSQAVAEAEHVWRELSHLYTSFPEAYSDLPAMAAQHMLDGFPLELMDGDAGHPNLHWIFAVLRELHNRLEKLGKSRIFVLSVLGVQSSGKSTLLNLMFGVRLRTSVGQCTRGVNMVLVPSDFPEFDYVLLLDTEGIRAPEFHLMSGAVAHDNRMAIMSVLPSDATMMVVNGEQDNDIREVLPIVMLAYKGSNMAQENGGRLTSKLFFVYTRLNTTQTSKLKTNIQSLQMTLNESFHKIMGESVAEGKLSAFLRGFQADVENSDLSDVKFLGGLKQSQTPPFDVPDWSYGSDVLKIREYIHRQTAVNADWKASDLQGFIKCVDLVCACLKMSSFEVAFKDAMEYSNFQQLRVDLEFERTALAVSFLETFSAIERKITEQRNQKQNTALVAIEDQNEGDLATSSKNQDDRRLDLQAAREAMLGEFRTAMIPHEQTRTVAIKKLLERSTYSKWRAQEESAWDEYIRARRAHWELRIKDLAGDESMFQEDVDNYKKRIEKEIKRMLGNQDTLDRVQKKSPVEQKKFIKDEFDAIFRGVMEEAQDRHPAQAPRVKSQIDKIFETVLSSQYSWRKTIANFGNWLTSKLTGMDPRAKVLQEIDNGVLGLLSHTNAYDETVVHNAIKLALGKVGKDHAMGNEALQMVRSRLESDLMRKQQVWDAAHNVAQRLRAVEPRLLELAQQTAMNEAAAKILASQIIRALEGAIPAAYKEHAATILARRLATQSFMVDPRVMRAHLDLHLVRVLELGNEPELLDDIRNPQNLLEKVTSALIDNATTSKKGGMWKPFMDTIMNGLITASSQSVESAAHKSKFKGFQNELSNAGLPISICNELNSLGATTYPDDIDMNDVIKQVVDSLSKQQPAAEPTASEILKCLVTLDVSGSKPFCREFCQLCRAGCFRELGHDGNHNACHQPAGLGGSIWIADGCLLEDSCSSSVERNNRFRMNKDSPWHPYREYKTFFTTWENPSIDPTYQPKIREFIFAHYHELFARHYKAKPARHVPDSFKKWTLKVIEDELNAIVNKAKNEQ